MINDIPEKEKPRDKALRYGINTLSAKELLAILLRNGYRGKSVLDVAEELLEKAGGIQGIPKLSVQELCSVKGIFIAKALELKACFELGRRISFETVMDENVMRHQGELVHWIQTEIGSSLQEHFMVIFLDHFNRIKAHQILFTGTLDTAQVYPRDIFREAILQNCSGMILAHNHPSGDVSPSHADMSITGQLLILAQMMKMRILDHIIVSQNDFLSFHNEDLFEECLQYVTLTTQNIDNFL